jgi:hypothetical protein
MEDIASTSFIPFSAQPLADVIVDFVSGLL